MATMGEPGSPKIQKLAARKDIRGLLRALQQEQDLPVRQQVLHVLGELRSADAVQPVIALLTDDDQTLRVSAITTLGQIGSADAVEPLIGLLKDKHPEIHVATAQALSQIGSSQALDPLTEAIRKYPESIAKTAFDALLKIGARVRDNRIQSHMVSQIISLMNGTPSEIQQNAATTLEQLGWKPNRDTDGARYLIVKGDWENCIAIGEAAVPPLIDGLNDPDNERQQAAFWSLVKIGIPAVEPLMVTAMDTEHPAHQPAFWALVKIGTPTVELFLEMLTHSEAGRREVSAKVLGQIGDQQALQPLYKAASDEHWAVREAACTALVRLGKPATQALTSILHSPHDDVRWIAANGLARLGWHPKPDEEGVLYCIARGDWQRCAGMGAVAIKPLTAMLYHWDENVRKNATWALTKVGTPAAPSLLKALQSDEPLARLSAARALGQIGDQQAITALNAALQDEYSDIRLAAIGALLRLGASGTMMVAALKNEEPGVRKAAAWALGHHRFADGVKPLILALQDEEAEVRVSVAKALGAIGDERALQPLLSLSHDPEPEVRAVANEATNTISQAQAQVS